MTSTKRSPSAAGPDGSPARPDPRPRARRPRRPRRSTAGRRSPWTSATTWACTGCCRRPWRRSTQQMARCYEQFKAKDSDVEKWVFLTQLHDSNEVLFYRLVGEHVHEMLPIVYTPTVGAAIQEFSHLFRRPRGRLPQHRGRRRHRPGARRDRARARTTSTWSWPPTPRRSSASATGASAASTSRSASSRSTRSPPASTRARVLAVGLDVGTNREELLNDPRYLGLRRSRVRGEEYDAFIDTYVAAPRRGSRRRSCTGRTSPGPPARGILARYGDTLCTFDDDIQGTAAVGLACVLAGVRVSGGRLVDQQIVVFGAGSAGRRHRRPDRAGHDRGRAHRARRRPAGSTCSTARACSPAT